MSLFQKKKPDIPTPQRPKSEKELLIEAYSNVITAHGKELGKVKLAMLTTNQVEKLIELLIKRETTSVPDIIAVCNLLKDTNLATQACYAASVITLDKPLFVEIYQIIRNSDV